MTTSTYDSVLISRKEVAEETMEFTVKRPEGLEIRAGQFLDIVLPISEKISADINKHGFSLVSAPYEENLAVTTRMRKSSAFKNAIREVPDGTDIQIIAPFGDFTLHKTESVPAVFIAGGIGITPIRSMIRQATHDKTSHKMTLFYCNRSPERAAYTEEFQQLAAENSNFTFVPVYTRLESGNDSAAEYGHHIDGDMIKRHVSDLESPRYYISGPEEAVRQLRKMVIAAGANEDNVRSEEFEGY